MWIIYHCYFFSGELVTSCIYYVSFQDYNVCEEIFR